MLGIQVQSRFWKSVWTSWKALRQLMVAKAPMDRDDALAQLISGTAAQWSDEARAFFDSSATIATL